MARGMNPTLFAALAAAALFAPAARAIDLPKTSPGGLVLVPHTALAAVYMLPGVDLAKYDKFALVDTYVEFKKGWLEEQNQEMPFSVTPEYMTKTKAWLAAEFKKEFTRELTRNGGFQIVDTVQPGTLVLRPAIVNLDITAPDTMQPGENSFVASQGSMTLYLEILDAQTNQLLARIYDAEAGNGDGGMQWATSVGNAGAADEIIDRWAEILRKALERARVKAGESPDGAPAPATPPAPK